MGLFLLGFQKLFRGDILTQLRSADQSGQLARVAYIAYGVLVSLMFAGIPYGMFPSFGNVINSVVFPIVISIILALNKYAAEIRRPEKT